MSNKTTFIGSTIILLAIIALFFLTQNNRVADKATTEFVGNIIKVEGSNITVEGKYRSEENDPEAKVTSVTVNVNASTILKRLTFDIPSKEELAKTDGYFYPEKLPKNESVTTINQLNTDLTQHNASVVVKSEGNIYRKKNFAGSEVIYTLPSY